MAAGQLGGPLHPTHDKPNQAANASFGEAIQAWNKHDYRDAVEMFKAHVAKYPDSPWAAEAVLHVGCDATYNGRYTEAAACFESILQTQAPNPHAGAQMMVHKARARLANLRTAQGNFPEAIEHYRILKQTSPDWRDRTYASAWIMALSQEKHHQLAMVNCGVQALARLLKKRGKKADADKVRDLLASSPRGQSMQELQTIAAGYGYRLTGLRLTTAQLKELPLPAIVQVSGLKPGDLGHYWLLEKRTRNTLKFYDPQSQRRFSQTNAEFAREWGGNALVLTRHKRLPGIVLSAREMENLYGGCCGAKRPPPPGPGPGGPPPPPPYYPPCNGPGCGGGCGFGSPKWSVNRLSLNVYVRDIPLWYRSPIGPPVQIDLSYNSQASLATYEPFGNKWQFNYGTYLVEDSGGQVLVIMPTGRIDIFNPDSSGGVHLRRP